MKVKLATTLDLNDFGVADVDGDSQLDVFSLNHGSQELILLNDSGTFLDGFAGLGLSQSGVEGWEPALMESPPATRDGLSIYWAEHVLVLENHSQQAFGGSIEFIEDTSPNDVSIAEVDDLEVRAEAFQTSSGENRVRVVYRSAGPGAGRIARPNAVATVLTFDDGTDLARVYLGARAANPSASTILLLLRDRHAAAWSDFDCDGRTDTFIARGGVRNRMRVVSPPPTDELLLASEQGFKRVEDSALIEKGECPARQVGWIDANLDLTPDVYMVCDRVGSESRSAHRLYLRGPSLTFEEGARAHGLDLMGGGAFSAEDIDLDGDQDLIWASAQEGRLHLLDNDAGLFREASSIVFAGTPTKIAKGDYDGDGDVDVLVVSSDVSTLLENVDGALQEASLQDMGIPVDLLDANWLDYEGDGDLDLHTIPHGVLLQDSGRFARTEILRQRGGASVRSTWADMNNDGRRDFVVAVLRDSLVPWNRIRGVLGMPALPGVWDAFIYFDQRPPGASAPLSVDVLSACGRAPALGARLLVTTSFGSQRVHVVGEAEGSRFSAGHYRLYAHVPRGDAEAIIVWPDGSRDEIDLSTLGQSPSQPLTIRPPAP